MANNKCAMECDNCTNPEHIKICGGCGNFGATIRNYYLGTICKSCNEESEE